MSPNLTSLERYLSVKLMDISTVLVINKGSISFMARFCWQIHPAHYYLCKPIINDQGNNQQAAKEQVQYAVIEREREEKERNIYRTVEDQ